MACHCLYISVRVETRFCRDLTYIHSARFITFDSRRRYRVHCWRCAADTRGHVTRSLWFDFRRWSATWRHHQCPVSWFCARAPRWWRHRWRHAALVYVTWSATEREIRGRRRGRLRLVAAAAAGSARYTSHARVLRPPTMSTCQPLWSYLSRAHGGPQDLLGSVAHKVLLEHLERQVTLPAINTLKI